MRCTRLPLALLLCVLCAGLLSACSSRPTEFYMLSGDSTPLSAATMPEPTMALGAVSVPGYLDRLGVVVLADEGTSLTVPRFNIWAEPLQQGLRRVISSMLTEPLCQAGVTVMPFGADNPRTDFVLHQEIVRLDADTSGRVVMEARWALISRNSRSVCGRGSFAFQEQVDMPAFGTEAMFNTIVAAESRLVQAYARAITPELARLVKQELAKPVRGRYPD